MRIIAGAFKRHVIPPPQSEKTRPTLDRVRQRIFDLLSARHTFKDACVLDLFAGTGALGFESASRGATHVTFVENDLQALNNIRLAAMRFKIDPYCRFAMDDVRSYLSQSKDTFDFIFADPPYAFTESMSLIEKIVGENRLKKNGWLVFEHASSVSLSEANAFTFAIQGNKRISVSFFHSI